MNWKEALASGIVANVLTGALLGAIWLWQHFIVPVCQ